MKKIFLTLLLSVLLLPCFASEKSWEYVDTYPFSGEDLNTNPHTFDNLLGDTYDYRIYAVLDGVAGNDTLYFQFNGDTGNNYRRYDMTGVTSTASAGVIEPTTLIPFIFVGSSLTDYRFLSKVDIYGSSGSERIVVGMNSGGNTANTYIQKRFGAWTNTTDELNSIIITSTATTALTGEFYLFHRQKESIYNASDWVLIKEDSWSSVNLSSSPITINNLQGDTDKEYMFEGEASGGAVNFYLLCNGDSGSNYPVQYLWNDIGSLASASGTQTGFRFLNFSDTVTASSFKCLINAESGKQRSCLSTYGNNYGSGTVQNQQTFWWSNTADEIDNFVITSESVSTSGKYRLHKRSTDRSTPSHEKLIYDYDISGDFSGGQEFLNLDTNKIYRIDTGNLKSSADFNLELEINGDSGANYIRQYLRGTASTASAANSTVNEILLGGVSSDNPGISSLLLFPKTGKYRPAILTSGYETGGAYYNDLNAYWWTNTTDNVQEVKIFASASTSMTGKIKIWEIDAFAQPEQFFSATGGTITYDGDYKIHTFTSSGDFVVTNGGDVECLVIAGGGGGATGFGGGGGAGGFVYRASADVSADTYSVVIGAGGTAGVSGSDSTFDGITAVGGGRGGTNGTEVASGGSGGGGKATGGGSAGGSGTQGDSGGGTGYGNNGGAGNDAGANANTVSGGGGGADAVGADWSSGQAGDGGSGRQSSISGSAVYYAGGGGGGAYAPYGSSAGTGGQGGGGNGNDVSGGNGYDATANTGSGGGGGAGGGPSIGGSGAGGIIIIRYKYK